MVEAKYLQVMRDIENQIQQGELSPGQILPSENDLCKEYSLSRMSVRKGLDILTRNGYITSAPGRGYFVNEPKVDRYTFSFDETKFIKAHIDDVKLHRVDIITPTLEVCAELSISNKKKVIILEHIYFSDEQPAAYAVKYFPYQKGSPFVEGEIGYATYPDKVLKKKYPFALQKSLSISAEITGQVLMEKLGLRSPDAVLAIGQRFTDTEKKPVLWGKLYILSQYSQIEANSVL